MKPKVGTLCVIFRYGSIESNNGVKERGRKSNMRTHHRNWGNVVNSYKNV
jgi:hypothetical protein